jgi:TonB family protein
VDVTDVLRDRMQEPAGLQRMVTVSLGLHVLAATIVVFAPGRWIGRVADAPRKVMTISIAGGGEGPRNGGLTTMGGRPVQVQTPPEEIPKREPIRPPAAKAPEMTVPLKGAKPIKATPAPAVKQAPDEARGRTPTRGAQTTPGTTVADTGVRGQGFGLSTGGGPGSGSSLDVDDFCCPCYLSTMIDSIRRGWNQNQGSVGQCVIKFTVQRDGQIVNPSIEKSSGFDLLNFAALRAVLTTKTLPPLPAEFPNPTLTVHLNFQYK